MLPPTEVTQAIAFIEEADDNDCGKKFNSLITKVQSDEYKDTLCLFAISINSFCAKQAYNILIEKYGRRNEIFTLDTLPTFIVTSYWQKINSILHLTKDPDVIYQKMYPILSTTEFSHVKLLLSFPNRFFLSEYVNNLPKNKLIDFAVYVLDNTSPEEAKAIFPYIFKRNPSIIDLAIRPFKSNTAYDKALTACIGSSFCPELSDTSFITLSMLFLSGKASFTSELFAAYCFYISSHLCQIPLNDKFSDPNFALSVFNAISSYDKNFIPQVLPLVSDWILKSMIPSTTFVLLMDNFTVRDMQNVIIHLLNNFDDHKLDLEIMLYHARSSQNKAPKELLDIVVCTHYICIEPSNQLFQFANNLITHVQKCFFDYDLFRKIANLLSDQKTINMSLTAANSMSNISTIGSTVKVYLNMIKNKDRSLIDEIKTHFMIRPSESLLASYIIATSLIMENNQERAFFLQVINDLIPSVIDNLRDIKSPDFSPQILKDFINSKPTKMSQYCQFFDQATKNCKNVPKFTVEYPKSFVRNYRIKTISPDKPSKKPKEVHKSEFHIEDEIEVEYEEEEEEEEDAIDLNDSLLLSVRMQPPVRKNM